MVPAISTTKPATCSPARACWLRAWDRAKAEKLIPFLNADGTWAVKSYTITITGAGWSDLSCNCAAGRNGRICKHAAVTAKAIAAHVTPIRGTEKGGRAVLHRNPATLTPTMAATYTAPAHVLVSGVAPSMADLYL